jgi:hypothetical protein
MPIIEHRDLRKKIEISLFVFLVFLSMLYGGFKLFPLIIGPRITIYNPHSGDTVSRPIFELSGKVSKVKEITVQGRPIPIGTDGHFTEILLVQDPYTIIVITATDFYGKTISKILRVTPEK